MKPKLLSVAFLIFLSPTFSVFAQQVRGYVTDREFKRGTVPRFQIFDIGVVQSGDSASQGLGTSNSGAVHGRSFRTGGSQAFIWNQNSGITGLPNFIDRTYCLASASNSAGLIIGTCSNSFSGAARLPIIWQNGMAAQLPLPAGESIGDANDINASGIAVGSVDGGSTQQAVIYSNGSAAVISQTTPNRSFFVTAFGINDSGRIVGQGIDPSNAARNVGIAYDIGAGAAFEVGALPGANGALAFGVSNSGHIVGSSMQNQGSGRPFIWTSSSGITEIPLPAGTSQGSARAVNSDGWAVGTASSAFAIPFVYDGSNTYRIADLIPPNTGWDLSTNTSSSATGISDNGVITGTGVFNGQIRAYALVPIINVTIGGQIRNSWGYPISNALVTITGAGISTPIVKQTGSFGYFHFSQLSSGTEYTVTVQSGRNVFSPASRTITPQADVNDFDFIAQP